MDWKDSLKRQASTLTSLLGSEELAKDVDIFLSFSRNLKGMLYFTGVGKNMFVAARVAATFDSLGIRSMFVDPVNTLHGSMGIFFPSDMVVAISKSGETEELNRFLVALRKIGFARIAAITANRGSTMSGLSMMTIEVSIEQEGDHLGLAPIASTMLFSAVLDSIAVQLSSENGFSKEDFIRNHPGGSLGNTVL